MAEWERVELDERSWVDVARGWLPDADELYAELAESVPWEQTRVFRYDHWQEEPRLTTWFRVAGAPPRLLEVQKELQDRYRVLFDGFAMNWYQHARHGQAFHRDRDMKWLDETVIGILTLGAQRPWLLRPRANRYDHSAPNKGATLDLAPASGDLFVMGGATQVGWEHSVAQLHHPVAGRMSAQWRWTSRRGRQEVGGSYSKPRTFSR
ncbi:MAG: putative alkylated repair protein [Actinomycetia bacterium]|nr:putative alkylated repair protein [Actinomycetes bacterium]